MADDDLTEQVTCWVCFEIMEDPTTLVCSHSFCKDCLVKVYKRDPNCPFCRRPFGLPLPDPNEDILALVRRLKGPAAGQVDPANIIEIEQESALLDLPFEVTSRILEFLPPYQLSSTGLVCRAMRDISEAPWMWKNMCMEQFPFVGGAANGNDWRRTFFRRLKLKTGWEGGKSGDFKVVSMRGHDGYINSIDLLKNQAITGGSNGQIKVWRTNTSKMSYECQGHTALVSTVQFNDIYILSGSYDRTVKLWDTQTGTLLRSMEYNSEVSKLRFDDRVAIVLGSDSLCSLYDIRSSSTIASQSGGALANPRDIVVLESSGANEGGRKFARADIDGCHLFDSSSDINSRIHSFSKPFIGVSFIAPAGGDLLALASGNEIILWNWKTGQSLWSCPLPIANTSSSITCFKADSERIIAGTSDGHVFVAKHRNPALLKIAAHPSSPVNDLQFDPLRLITAGGDNSIKVWDIKSGKILYTLLGGSLQIRGSARPHPSKPGCSALVYDENRIVASFANVLKSFNFGYD